MAKSSVLELKSFWLVSYKKCKVGKTIVFVFMFQGSKQVCIVCKGGSLNSRFEISV